VSRKTLSDRVALAVATGLGVGYAPVVPGTFGSLPGVAAAWLLWTFGGSAATTAGLLLVVPVGVWAATRAEAHFGRIDPGAVVIDEVAGQILTLAFLPLTPRVLLAGFLLFRVLDILKPFPARRLESLPGGSGIMADDLAAGIYGNILLQGAVHFLRGWLVTA
jgi:phosphatidylglycerophosphatase A